MADRPDTAERTCVVTRTAQPPEGLLRFVRAPDGAVVPDVRGKLPGRGVWVTARRDMVAEAVRRKLFARGFKAEATVDPGLPDLVDRLLAEVALSSLSMARKAGRVVTGFGKVTAALGRDKVVAVIHAEEARDDGRRKVAQAIRRRLRADAGDDLDDAADDDFDDEDDDTDAKVGRATLDEGAGDTDMRDEGAAETRDPLPPVAVPHVVAGLFRGADLDLALGGTNVIHAALLAGGVSTSFLRNAAALARYRGGSPDVDWMADLGRGDRKG
ncbi:RNA-binding protein [Oharaeibacter diazotrophicus]|uniref:Putative RNA-binding protein YlxR (DUF448 family) n=1 Tax=Oharaeibacter diazotrophicus TaxID=1920512 RepID=A0A4R6R6D9_9HYPH|nr:RNA-binding protein [Oharaeibacter diazotrophicus]TDP81500.1 putative RNA-binding protein YlxR (DUF448 family) [Oharaeibacter diazotrophicus]BBE73738.1 hypothetical protein OHA_1_03354 [Pleomorphomonas sp. SM30]GLS75528.1 hypothetical protein GCM10007904_08630 [Oharaeibacter diazotrophicus]